MKAAQLRVGLLSMLLVIGSSAPADAEEADAGWEKVVFQVDETANASWSVMLARSYLDDSPKARVVVVAYGQGVDFQREDAKDKRGNPYDHRVLSLADRAVEVRVCAATLGAKAIAKEDLLDPVVIVTSGISEIARLQLKEGFASLKP